jgi:hypothetical protein
MALSQPALKQSFLSLFTRMKQSEISEEEYADGLAEIITGFVKTAQVKPGIPVSTAGSAAAQTGKTTGTGELV